MAEKEISKISVKKVTYKCTDKAAETTANKVSSIDDTSTEGQYPSAKAVYSYVQPQIGKLDELQTETKSNLVAAINEAATKGGDVTTPDWNQNDETAPDYIKNRPGGYYKQIPGYDFEWDGDTTGRTTISTGHFELCKISDEILNIEDLIGAVIKTNTGSGSSGLTSEDIHEQNGIIVGGEEANIVVNTTPNNSLQGLTFQETGLYFKYTNNTSYTASLTKSSSMQIVPIKGELTNIKGGYDIEGVSSTLLDKTISHDEFTYDDGSWIVNIALEIAPVIGASVSGTINGEAVSGVWKPEEDLRFPYLQLGENYEILFLSSGMYKLTFLVEPAQSNVISLEQTTSGRKVVIPADYVDLSGINNVIDPLTDDIHNVSDCFSATQPVSMIGQLSSMVLNGKSSLAEVSDINDCYMEGTTGFNSNTFKVWTPRLFFYPDTTVNGKEIKIQVNSTAAKRSFTMEGKVDKFRINNSSTYYGFSSVQLIGVDGSSYVYKFTFNVNWGSAIISDAVITITNGYVYEKNTLLDMWWPAPDNAPNKLYLKSSTASSSKVFGITVDDTGTLTATEVT